MQVLGPFWEAEGQDGCFYTQVPYHVSELVGLDLEKESIIAQARAGTIDSTREERVCWVAACGCRRIALKKYKGLDSATLKHNKLTCTGLCSGAARKRGLCYCHALVCKACSKIHRFPVSEEARMMKVTRHVVHERRVHGHEWVLFAEVPITDSLGNRMSVDVMLVLEGFPFPAHEPLRNCVLAIEHQGTTHERAWPLRGDREAGQTKQENYDGTKKAALQALGVPLMYCYVERDGCAVSLCCMNAWHHKLREQMIQYERLLAERVSHEVC